MLLRERIGDRFWDRTSGALIESNYCRKNFIKIRELYDTSGIINSFPVKRDKSKILPYYNYTRIPICRAKYNCQAQIVHFQWKKLTRRNSSKTGHYFVFFRKKKKEKKYSPSRNKRKKRNPWPVRHLRRSPLPKTAMPRREEGQTSSSASLSCP